MLNILQVFDRANNKLKTIEGPVHFQCFAWDGEDFPNGIFSNGEDRDEDYSYEVYISGATQLGQSVSVRIPNFTPFFYIGVPESWGKMSAKLFFSYLKEKMGYLAYGLRDFKLVKSKKIYPFLNNAKFNFVQLIFGNIKAFNRCKYMFKREAQDKNPIKPPGVTHVSFYEIFESNIDNLNRICHVAKLETTGWAHVNNYTHDAEGQYTTSQISLVANWKDIVLDPTTISIVPFTLFSWDIECCPENTEEFPNPDLPNDEIRQISVALHRYGTTDKQCFIFTDRDCDTFKICEMCDLATHDYDQKVCGGPVKSCANEGKDCAKICKKKECLTTCPGTTWYDANVIKSNGEKRLIESFLEFIRTVDPDLFMGYNTWRFDDLYLWKRVKHYDIDMNITSRIKKIPVKQLEKILKSSAYGDNGFYYISFPGRVTFDVMVAIKREYNFDEYNLKYVSDYFLKNTKVDLTIRTMFEKLNGDAREVAICAAYCIQDSNLVMRLFLKLSMLPSNIEMAKTVYVPITWLLLKGQQCKVFSSLCRLASIRGYIIYVHENGDITSDKVKGATVVSPKVGMYFEPIVTLDFASLYPSIMMALNLCYTTYIATAEMLKYVQDNGIEYNTVIMDYCTDFNCKDSSHCAHEKVKRMEYFVKPGKNNEYKGLIPEMLEQLMQGRKNTKKLMKNVTDAFMYAVLDAKQKAQKITMNSTYGFTGADKGLLPCKVMTSCVTATGRRMIEETGNIAIEKFNAKVIYGDSIPGRELITVTKKIPGRSNVHLHVTAADIPIAAFAESVTEVPWEEYRGFKVGDVTVKNKEYKNLENCNYYTRTSTGYEKIKKVIRHETSKALYKVKAMDVNGNMHQVVVTEGHSLIAHDKSLIEAQHLKPGTLLYNYMETGTTGSKAPTPTTSVFTMKKCFNMS